MRAMRESKFEERKKPSTSELREKIAPIKGGGKKKAKKPMGRKK